MPRPPIPAGALALLILAGACSAASTPSTAPDLDPAAPRVRTPNPAQAAEVGTPFSYDATLGGTAFSGASLTYSVSFAPSANGLAAVGGRITGVPAGPAVVTATVTATGPRGERAAQHFPIVAFARGLTAPSLPAVPFAYSDARVPLPPHFTTPGPAGRVVALDNTPPTNPTTDAGAALGRVLFHDRRLSANDALSCASCHQQALGFADSARFSRGFAGGLTARHSMGLANARFYRSGRFFWDERAATLEEQVLGPIQNQVEMGMTLENLVIKIRVTRYYPDLFRAAFGTPDVTPERIARALAQYVRSLSSTGSRYDQAFAGTADPRGFVALGEPARQGHQLFVTLGCAACHTTHAHVGDGAHNIGLDAVDRDAGAGNGRFKAPSLRNAAVRGRYMHDGRFASLGEVIDFYDRGVQPNPGLDSRLRAPDGRPRRLNLTAGQREALIAYLGTLTDSTLLTSPRFSDPFPRR